MEISHAAAGGNGDVVTYSRVAIDGSGSVHCINHRLEGKRITGVGRSDNGGGGAANELLCLFEPCHHRLDRIFRTVL